MFNPPVRIKPLKPNSRPKDHFTPYFRERHKDVLSEHDKRFSYAGVEFGLVLSATVYFGALASAVALDDDNSFKSILLEFLPWAAWTFAGLGTVVVCSPLASTPLPFYQWLTRAAVFATMLIVIGINSQIVGVESVRNSPSYAAHLSWQQKVKEQTQELEARNSELDVARRDFDSCLRQREALRIEARLQSARRTPLETIGLMKRIRDFCQYERKIFDQIYRARDEHLSSMEALLREKPSLDEGST